MRVAILGFALAAAGCAGKKADPVPEAAPAPAPVAEPVGEPAPAPEAEPAPAPEAEPTGGTVPACPDTATKRYVAAKAQCEVIRYKCAEGESFFGDDCGCGCTTQK